jgi:hypothetical protein
MPSEMNKAFFKSIVDLAQNTGDIDNVLAKLDEVQAGAYNQ